MADSITPTDIPVNDPTTGRPWDYVLGYVDGHFTWPASGWARFPQSRHVRCAVFASTLDADVLDQETGDATAAEAVAWVQAKRARGDAEPTVYTAYGTWGALQAAFNAARVPHPHYGVAAYPGSGPVQETLNGFTSVFHQYQDPITSGGHWDTSVVVDSWLNPLAPLTITEASDMFAVRNSSGWLRLVMGTGKWYDIKTEVDLNATTWNGVPIVTAFNDDDLAILEAQNNRWEHIQNVLAALTTTVTVTGTFPTHYRSTDLGGGVTDTVAVVPPPPAAVSDTPVSDATP
jgi:hypothetical protein